MGDDDRDDDEGRDGEPRPDGEQEGDHHRGEVQPQDGEQVARISAATAGVSL